MIWLSWRQFRVQAAAVYGALAAVAALLAVTGGHLAELAGNDAASFAVRVAHGSEATLYEIGFVSVLILPAIIGVFWGAPLVTREFEAGTHRLVWNQSVTRTRWLATKLALGGLAAMAAAGLLSLVVTWWCHPIDTAINAGAADEGIFSVPRMAPLMFAARGLAPIGYAAFAFVLGVTVGLLLRRTVPAMAVTLVVYVAVQFAVPALVRAHLAPVRDTVAITADNLRGFLIEGPDGGPVHDLLVKSAHPGAWVIANQPIDAAGRAVDALPPWVIDCGPTPPGVIAAVNARAGCFARLAREGYRQRISYQPTGRYWTFQVYETLFFAALSGLLAAVCFWRLRS